LQMFHILQFIFILKEFLKRLLFQPNFLLSHWKKYAVAYAGWILNKLISSYWSVKEICNLDFKTMTFL
jgi:hypothetical protein